MADVFEPRKLLAHPQQFGRFRDGQLPANQDFLESDHYRAANLQHVISYEFRRWISETRSKLEWFAERETRLGRKISLDRLRRVLRGETMMQFTDLMLFTRNSPNALEAMFEFFERPDNEADHELNALRLRVSQFEWMIKELNIQDPRTRAGRR